MNRKKTISLEDRKKIQLEMLDEVHAFCKEKNIKYSLAFGTLLGAIRHKGFIPWDDDVDIMMPLPDLLRFKKEFKSEIIEYHDVDNDKYHCFPFSLLTYKPTYSKYGLFYRGIGVSIDLYVCIGIPESQELFFNNLMPLYNQVIKANKRRFKIIRFLPIKTIPFFSKTQKKYRNYLFNNAVLYQNAHHYYMIAGPIKDWKIMSYDYDLFGDIIEAQFEDRVYSITGYYDKFLTLRYGDYMTPPPPEQQCPIHGGEYYWENK